jgi:hypothetical protein
VLARTVRLQECRLDRLHAIDAWMSFDGRSLAQRDLGLPFDASLVLLELRRARHLGCAGDGELDPLGDMGHHQLRRRMFCELLFRRGDRGADDPRLIKLPSLPDFSLRHEATFGRLFTNACF